MSEGGSQFRIGLGKACAEGRSIAADVAGRLRGRDERGRGGVGGGGQGESVGEGVVHGVSEKVAWIRVGDASARKGQILKQRGGRGISIGGGQTSQGEGDRVGIGGELILSGKGI